MRSGSAPPPDPERYETLRAAERLLRVAGANLAKELKDNGQSSARSSRWFELADILLDLFPEIGPKGKR